MSAQRIPLETVQKVQQYLRSNLTLPASENQPRSWSSYTDVDAANELPAPDSLSELGDLFSFGGPVQAANYAPNTRGQWFISSINPGAALLKLPGLRLKSGLRLVSCLRRTPDRGSGITWAIPEAFSTTLQLEQALVGKDGVDPPCPTGALEDVMEAMEGDRSLLSFLIASLLRRELQQLGTLGEMCQWSHHRLMNALPDSAVCKWQSQPPQDLLPKGQILPDGRAAIEFFTYCAVTPFAIFQHRDRYAAEGYKAVGIDRAIGLIQS